MRALKFQVKWEGFLGKCHCRQPDSGNPTVRDEKGACGNVGQRLEGEQLTRSSRLRRGVYLKSTAQMLNWRSRAPYFYPDWGGGGGSDNWPPYRDGYSLAIIELLYLCVSKLYLLTLLSFRLIITILNPRRFGDNGIPSISIVDVLPKGRPALAIFTL